MRVVLLNQFYPPDDAPTGRYAHDLARCLVERGHEALAVCSRQAYTGSARYPARSIIDGVQVRRVASASFGRLSLLGKAIDYLSFFALATVEIARIPAIDAIVSLTTPPWIGLAARAASDAPRFTWIMDLYPDALSAHGGTLAVMAPVLAPMTRCELASSALVVALGPAMAQRIERGYSASRVLSAPLWAPPGLAPPSIDEAAAIRRERGWDDGRLVLMYSGNLGLGHRFAEFLSAAEALGPAGPRWAFCGAGKRAGPVAAFASAHPELPIQVMSQVPRDRLAAHLGAGDVHLVSLADGWQGIMVPSKIQAAFAVGRPVLFVGGADSEPARWIAESGGGWAVPGCDVRALLLALEATRDPIERARRGAAALRFARERFDANANCLGLARAIESYAARRVPS
jgi:hypothetical protein